MCSTVILAVFVAVMSAKLKTGSSEERLLQFTEEVHRNKELKHAAANCIQVRHSPHHHVTV
jgi:hypothetical protein